MTKRAYEKTTDVSNIPAIAGILRIYVDNHLVYKHHCLNMAADARQLRQIYPTGLFYYHEFGYAEYREFGYPTNPVQDNDICIWL